MAHALSLILMLLIVCEFTINNATQNVNLNSGSNSEHTSRRKIWHLCSTSLQPKETCPPISRLSVHSPSSNFLDETNIFFTSLFPSVSKMCKCLIMDFLKQHHLNYCTRPNLHPQPFALLTNPFTVPLESQLHN